MTDAPRPSQPDSHKTATPSSFKSKDGINRIFAAAGYSINGLKAAWAHEASFRQEVIVVLLLAVASIWLAPSFLFGVLMNACLLMILGMELVNSAIEALADAVTLEHNELVGRAKDLGSAAVLFSLLITLLVWGSALYLRFLA